MRQDFKKWMKTFEEKKGYKYDSGKKRHKISDISTVMEDEVAKDLEDRKRNLEEVKEAIRRKDAEDTPDTIA